MSYFRAPRPPNWIKGPYTSKGRDRRRGKGREKGRGRELREGRGRREKGEGKGGEENGTPLFE